MNSVPPVGKISTDALKKLSESSWQAIPTDQRDLIRRNLLGKIEKEIKNKIVDENMVIPKKDNLEFLFSELWAYFSQFLIFFFIVVLSTQFLTDEKKFEEFVTKKLPSDLWLEFGWTFVAIAVVGSITWLISKGILKQSDEKVREIFVEFPRTIYLFGSSASAIFFSIALYLQKHPATPTGKETPISLLGAGLVILISFFVFGCLVSYAVKGDSLKK